MLLQSSPNWWSCLPTAFAACFGIPVRDLIKELGHDGSEMLFPEDPEPFCRRGFHIQEFIKPCLMRGLAPVFIEAQPSIESKKREVKPLTTENVANLSLYMHKYNGIVIGMKPNNHEHALAWNMECFYNSDGKSYQDYDIDIVMFIALLNIGR